MAEGPIFEAVSANVSFPQLDEQTLAFWDDQAIFEKAVSQNKDGETFVFYEGPPTANGMPHAGHVLTRVMKDVFLRYHTMRGRYVPRRAGWDTHGLPVEVEVEKALGIRGREAIEAYGLEKFSRACIESVFRYIDEWRKMTRRIGFWVDLDDAYVTFHKTYIESVWWALKTLFDQGLLYQDYKVVWWWAQGGTALSAGEVGQGYKDVDDPSVLVRFPLADAPDTSFLAWTTTPWTLPSNIALAVKDDADYITVKTADEQLIVAAALGEHVLKDIEHEVLSTQKGSDLIGKKYTPPFSFREPEPGVNGNKHHEVMRADFVELSTGSGLVHCAPAFGEDDFAACKENGFGFLQVLDPDGRFPDDAPPFSGTFCKDADKEIIQDLKRRKLLFRRENYRHEYPFCWRRMEDPLIQYARRSWFIRTTKKIDKAIANNQRIHWEPEHIKDGRFGQFLNGNVDWALSRERFWGTPLPIWVNDETGTLDCVASASEILERNPQAFDHFKAAKEKDPSLSDDLMVHKPWIDDVTWQKDGEPGTYRRVPEVIDCWFDSGCMPFAQHGYPHQNSEAFNATFPSDFITEAVDQTRGWFYSLLMISTLLFEKEKTPHPYKNCVVLGLLTDKDGKKYSKSLKNYTDPLELMAQHGGDGVRWALYAGTVPGQNTRFFDGTVSDAVREYLLKIWNVYSFFVTYANIDAFDPRVDTLPYEKRSELDHYILAELERAKTSVTRELDDYKSHMAVRHLQAFVDALSNWYVRRSRARFWGPGLSDDKRAAYATLYEVLREFSALSAPFTPFMSEALHQNLKRGDADSADSVHLTPYPTVTTAQKNEELCDAVALTRRAIGLGQKVRAEAKIKVRQPLGVAHVAVASQKEKEALARFEKALKEELNVEALSFVDDLEHYVSFEILPNFRALGPTLGKRIPLLKKALANADSAKLYGQLQKVDAIEIDLGGELLKLTSNDVEIRLKSKPGFAAASESGLSVILDTEITEVLKRKGIARDVLREIQKRRKDLDLAFDARIRLRWSAEGQVKTAIEEHIAWIGQECLASDTAEGIEDGIAIDVDGEEIHIAISPVS